MENRVELQNRNRLTHLITGWQSGCKSSEAKLYRFAYFRLKKLAKEKRSKCMQIQSEGLVAPHDCNSSTTELIHESYLKISSIDRLQVSQSREFFLMAAKAMQHILINRSWALKASKRQQVETNAAESPLSIERLSIEKRAILEQSLILFSEHYPRQSNVLKLKYYIGLKHSEISELLECSPSLVEKDLKFARSWLHTRIAV
ncbi:ECF-type sigma factor [Vibrio sp. 99-70-13A1]|uniref:ECF-type sigma factor n=1 Tax=Vibrio sp. 99-70-13A1 TaxID=2607601 RepID=UPI0014937CB6|nr:ECF-type sigma factor [Vibrio sp. 99-70-13A1]NOH97854.1 RNA polymerase subunit sigma [Vibrio sp. 99-70-13A1]